MSSVGLTEFRRPEPLDSARHDRSDFDSGEPALDTWLRRYAGQNRRGDTAATWVVATAEYKVVAYASLAMTAVDRSAAPDPISRKAPDPVPALLLGRLAVDKGHQGMGLGTALVAHVLVTAADLNAKAACRAVVVTALDRSARQWWEHIGFHPFQASDPDGGDLYLLTAEIEATLQMLEK